MQLRLGVVLGLLHCGKANPHYLYHCSHYFARSNVAPHVLRAKGACFARHDSREEAIAAYYGALEDGNVRIIL